MKIAKIKETCLYTTDLESAKNFYCNILGFEIIGYEKGKHIFFRAGESVLLCFNPDDSRIKTHPLPHYAEGIQHIAFEVDATIYSDYKSELIEKGVKIVDEITWWKGFRSFYFYDPAGHLLEVVQSGMWEKINQ